MSGYTIYRHPEVENDLFQILDLIEHYVGEAAAIRKLEQIEQTIQLLSQTPHMGSIRNELYRGLRAIPTAGKGVICFIVDDAQRSVYLICIAYAGSDWMSRIPKRTQE